MRFTKLALALGAAAAFTGMTMPAAQALLRLPLLLTTVTSIAQSGVKTTIVSASSVL